MQAWLITLILAFVVSAGQIGVKWLSKEPPPGKKHGLVLDDWVFWIDWFVSSVTALFLFLLGAAQEHKALGIAQVWAAVGALFLAALFGPSTFRNYCYDGHGNLKGWRHVAAANGVGLLLLLSAVSAGVKAYGA